MTDDEEPKSAQVARDAGEAIRTLNHLTIRDDDLRYPADVYTVIGALATLEERLPQTLQQLFGFRERQLQDGFIRHDDGTVAASTAIAAARRALLDEAVPTAQQLRAALGRAQQAVSGLSYAGP